MNNFCVNCNLNCELKNYQENLNNLILKKNMNLLDDEVIALSQEVDELLRKCIRCQKHTNIMVDITFIDSYSSTYEYLDWSKMINKVHKKSLLKRDKQSYRLSKMKLKRII